VPGYPAAAAPAQAPKKGRAGIIIVSILAVLFLLGSVAMSGLFLRASSDLDQQKKTTASQTTQISDLNKQLTDTKSQLTTLQESTSGQIADLKKAQQVSKTCVDDVDKLINAKSSSAAEKAFNAMVKACIVAKAAE
jgi:flagellar basal body-associated protein FliL